MIFFPRVCYQHHDGGLYLSREECPKCQEKQKAIETGKCPRHEKPELGCSICLAVARSGWRCSLCGEWQKNGKPGSQGSLCPKCKRRFECSSTGGG